MQAAGSVVRTSRLARRRLRCPRPAFCRSDPLLSSTDAFRASPCMGENTRFAAVIPHRTAFAGVLTTGSGVTEIRVLTTIALPRVYTTAQPVDPGARFFAECDARGPTSRRSGSSSWRSRGESRDELLEPRRAVREAE